MKEIIWLIIAISLVLTIHAFETSSSNYINDLDVTSGGSGSTSSANYNQLLSLVPIGGKTTSSNYINEIGFMHTMGDIELPTFENNATNTTTAKTTDWVRFNVTCKDNVGLHGFIFSHNNSEVWVNESYVRFSGTKNQSNFTLQITLAQSKRLGWRFICNDTYGNPGFMGIETFDINTIPAVPTIIYPENNAYLRQIDINVSSFDGDGNTINYTIFINDTFNISTQQNITDLSIGDGSYNLSISAYDGIDYSEKASILFTKDTIAPDITLITPINRSGDNDGNVVFEYTVVDANNVPNCSLAINRKLNITNITITNDIYQNFTLYALQTDSYNWSINCTDVAGNTNTTAARVFAVIKTTQYDGQTTDFSTVNVYALPNLILEKTSYGKISLIDAVDLGVGADFDSYMNMTDNLITINSTMLPLLNLSSDISLYSLKLSDPRPVMNGTACATPNCIKKSYIANNFTFNVTQLAPYNASVLITYSAEETPIPPVPPGPEPTPGPGQGTSAPTILKDIEYDFRLSRDEIRVKLKIGKDAQEDLEIRNLGTGELTFNIDIEELKDFISVSDYSFDLDIGERKNLILNIVGKKFGVFFGRLTATVENITKSIPIIIEIESEKALFDVKLDIPNRYRNIAPGDNLKAQITLFNVLGGKVDVMVNYLIKDLRGNVVSEESETFAVETQSSYVKEFKLPKNIEPGSYIAAIEVRYANSYAVSSQMFDVLTEEELLSLREARIKVLSIFFIVVVSSIIYVYVLTRLVRRRRRGY